MNADHVSIDRPRRYRSHRTYAVRFFGRRILVTVTRRSAGVRRWIYQTLRIHRRRLGSLIVGLGVQWLPKVYRGEPDPPVATLQLCVGHRSLIFQILLAHSIPASLSRFLSDPLTTFVGVGHRFDCLKLREHCGLKVANGREIRDLALRLTSKWNVSMEYLAKVALGFDGVRKPKRIGRSAWNAWELDEEQVQYACVDAYIAFQLGLKFLRT